VLLISPISALSKVSAHSGYVPELLDRGPFLKGYLLLVIDVASALVVKFAFFLSFGFYDGLVYFFALRWKSSSADFEFSKDARHCAGPLAFALAAGYPIFAIENGTLSSITHSLSQTNFSGQDFPPGVARFLFSRYQSPQYPLYSSAVHVRKLLFSSNFKVLPLGKLFVSILPPYPPRVTPYV